MLCTPCFGVLGSVLQITVGDDGAAAGICIKCLGKDVLPEELDISLGSQILVEDGQTHGSLPSRSTQEV